MKIHKNRILPAILIDILLMCIILFISIVFLTSVAAGTFEESCSNFDTLVEKEAQIYAQNMDRSNYTMELYSELAASSYYEDVKLLQVVNQLGDNSDFTDIGVVKSDGSILESDNSNTPNNEKEYLKDNYYKVKDTTIDYENECGKVIFWSPIIIDGYKVALLYATMPSEADVSEIIDTESPEECSLYVLDEKKHIVVSGNKEDDFAYDTIPVNMFYKNSIINEYTNDLNEEELETKIDGTIRKTTHMDELELEDLDTFQEIYGNSSKYWYESPVNLSNGRNWTLLVSNRGSFSNIAKSNLTISVMAIVVSTAVCLIILIISAIYQGISNRNLTMMAYYDSATEWYNWNRFKILCERVIRRRKQRQYAFIGFDISKFKMINDIDGHRTGDAILKNISLVLRKELHNKRECFTRYSADEFDMLLIYDSLDELINRIDYIDKAIKKATKGKEIRLCYGVYVIDDYKLAPETMNNYVSLAKDSIKHNHTECIAMYDENMRKERLKEQKLEENMERGIRNREFKVFLQPKYNPDGSEVKGAEALVRWISDDMGLISPNDFIPLFEKNSFIIKLDNYMVAEVCNIQKRWLNEGKNIVPISVNISRTHLRDKHLVDDIVGIVEEYGVPFDVIELELTESAFFEDREVVLETVSRFKKAGFTVSMDDFGSGYSSLNSLKDLELDIIKLDGEFFKMSGNVARSETIVEDTINLAKHLELKIVAEGIETKEQVEFLDRIGCDLIQGYYFAKPMPVDEYEDIILGNYNPRG